MTQQSNLARLRSHDAAFDQLRALCPPGNTIYTVLRHVAKSGMTRWLDVIVMDSDDGSPRQITRAVAEVAGYTRSHDKHGGALKAEGCGMDMGFAVVYNLSRALYHDGFGCIGERKHDGRPNERCPSNDHSNGDKDYHIHGAVRVCKSRRPCTCHDPYAWKDTGCYVNGCSDCGCARADHWHRDGGYALQHCWL